MTLNRRDQIFKYIVEHFIKTAQPVGSQTLIEEYHLPYSSATIRNEMNALEQMGLLEKVIFPAEEFLPVMVIDFIANTCAMAKSTRF